MIIDCISDLHGNYPTLEGGDLLIIAGDLTARDTFEQHEEFIEWLDAQSYTKKVVIAGNHDNNIYVDGIDSLRNASYLCDSFTEFEGLRIYGSPWTSWFHGINPCCKAFTLSSGKLEKKMNKIPYREIDILVTHSPPYGIFDELEREVFGERRQEFVGSPALRNRLLMGSSEVKLSVFGHIHEHGGKTLDTTRCKFVNASIVNERYEHVNKPVRIEL